MKIFNKNIHKNPKIIHLNNKISDTGKGKYLPSFSKEWKNIIYTYNKNTLKNLPNNTININKVIQSYFKLYFKNLKYIAPSKYIMLKRRRNLLRRIYVSNAEIKHTNDKAIITLFNVNRERKVLQKKYLKFNKKISTFLVKRYISLYKNNILNILNVLNKYKDEYIFLSDKINKRKYVQHKFKYLNKFIVLKNLYLKKIWATLILHYSTIFLKYLRKQELVYSLNTLKFNKLNLLSKLSNLLVKLLDKKVEYNIINLKSITFHPDIFTEALTYKMRKKRINTLKNILSVLNRMRLPSLPQNKINEENILNNYKDSKIISHIEDKNILNGIYNNNNKINTNKKDIHKNIFNSIGYKNMAGIRLEVKGRLTKRYRADRSISAFKWKGGLKNVDSSFKGLSAVLFRGNTKSNTSYSLKTSKRRIGSFAIKGWIAGK